MANKEKTEYKLIQATDNSGSTHISGLGVFENAVEDALANGWSLQGSVSVTMPNALGIKHYAQAMVRTVTV